jgi:uncharacterized membrane protein YgcG
MHPEVVRKEPAIVRFAAWHEPRNVPTEDSAELRDMSRRFWVSAALALPVFVMAMVADLIPQAIPDFISMPVLQWLEFGLATPVVLWGGWPVFQRGWASVVNRSLNMFTLIALRRRRDIQRGGDAAAGSFSSNDAQHDGHGAGVFRGCGGDHGAGTARPGDGIARAQPNQRCDQAAAGSRAENCTHRAR